MFKILISESSFGLYLFGQNFSLLKMANSKFCHVQCFRNRKWCEFWWTIMEFMYPLFAETYILQIIIYQWYLRNLIWRWYNLQRFFVVVLEKINVQVKRYTFDFAYRQKANLCVFKKMNYKHNSVKLLLEDKLFCIFLFKLSCKNSYMGSLKRLVLLRPL